MLRRLPLLLWALVAATVAMAFVAESFLGDEKDAPRPARASMRWPALVVVAIGVTALVVATVRLGGGVYLLQPATAAEQSQFDAPPSYWRIASGGTALLGAGS